MKNIIAADGHYFNVYHATPAGQPLANLVVVHEVFGVNPHIQSVCNKFSQQGFNVAAPALFDRVERDISYEYAADELQRGIVLAGKLQWQDIFTDIEATINMLNSIEQVPIFIVGYCFGGTVAFRSAHYFYNLEGAVCYYGGNIHYYREENSLCPLLMHFGTLDQYITQEQVAEIKAAQPHAEIYNYQADHGFNCDARPNYDQESATLAFQRTISFCKRYV